MVPSRKEITQNKILVQAITSLSGSPCVQCRQQHYALLWGLWRSSRQPPPQGRAFCEPTTLKSAVRKPVQNSAIHENELCQDESLSIIFFVNHIFFYVQSFATDLSITLAHMVILRTNERNVPGPFVGLGCSAKCCLGCCCQSTAKWFPSPLSCIFCTLTHL